MAGPGEQVEAFVARSTSTSVKAYGGEVESLTQASSAGVGVRVIVDHREGFAYAGTLDEAVGARGAGRGARQRRSSASPTSSTASPSPTASSRPTSTCGPTGLEHVPTADKVAHGPRARGGHHGPRPARQRRPRRHVQPTRRGEGAVATSTGHPRLGPGRQLLPDGAGPRRAGRRDADRRRPVGRAARSTDLSSTRRPTTPSCAPPGCSARPSRPRSGSPSCSSRG